ncbi:hypothetical protein ABB37_04678 [Leptomonas pyrrhocoris]|uniref:Uncharacterized protein n=1 Tax=Leptomonas pyrrhocoris TaxID=157538 RepID=A0A0M9G1G0_LEPPY|nr:hypothetical protein ABB37_04678 [Leptomonas pyrrhocoris]KPA80450.1 hypothetical protein ABB37_04678 [Leptomonas pyrrhocoris]|eukprot:XP_015658889.1 hypothetical protein ABB37_04678 [Leptomonas pyrrhocoris]
MMLDVAYIVRCQRCGVARKSYNDPRRGISVIECKRPCGNSHYDWSLVRIIPATMTWPPEPPEESDVLLYVPPLHPPPPPPPPLPSAERDASPSPTHPSAERDKKRLGKVTFKGKGNGSVVRSCSASAGAKVAVSVVSAKAVEENEEITNDAAGVKAASSHARTKKERGVCIVQ